MMEIELYRDCNPKRNFSEYEDIKGKEESITVEGAEQDSIEFSNNHTEDEERLKKSHDMHNPDTNSLRTENASEIAKSTISKNSVYGHTTSKSVAQLQGQQPELSRTQQSKPNIYRIGKTDRFGCKGCKITGDRWAMQDHLCSTSKQEGSE